MLCSDFDECTTSCDLQVAAIGSRNCPAVIDQHLGKVIMDGVIEKQDVMLKSMW